MPDNVVSISVGVYLTHLSEGVPHTSQWGCTSHISVGVYLTHLSGAVPHTSQWGCTSHISVGVYLTHLSGGVPHTSQWGCTSHISVGVYLTHPVMVRIDEFRAVYNLLAATSPSLATIFCRCEYKRDSLCSESRKVGSQVVPA